MKLIPKFHVPGHFHQKDENGEGDGWELGDTAGAEEVGEEAWGERGGGGDEGVGLEPSLRHCHS